MDERPQRRVGPQRERVSYYFTRTEYRTLACPLCRMNACVQRVEYAMGEGEFLRVTHGVHAELS